MTSTEDVQRMIGATVYGADGGRIGRVTQVLLHEETGQPEWAITRTGILRSSECFVPLTEASWFGRDGTVPYDKDIAKLAPRVDHDDGELSSADEAQLYRYYDFRHTDSQHFRGHGHLRASGANGPRRHLFSAAPRTP